MEKRKTALIMTICGLFLIIISATCIKFKDNIDKKEEAFLESNIKSASKKCVAEKKCDNSKIYLDTLLNYQYLSDEVVSKLDNYAGTSYVDYPSYKVYLFEKGI